MIRDSTNAEKNLSLNLPDPISRKEILEILGIGETKLAKLEAEGTLTFDKHPLNRTKSIPRARFEKQILAFLGSAANAVALAKSFENIAKVGARNSASDQKRLQAAHDHLVAMGACCNPGNDKAKDPAQMGPDLGNRDVTATPLTLSHHNPDAAVALIKSQIAKSRAKSGGRVAALGDELRKKV